MEFLPIAHIHTHYEEKFGIPRQSGLAPSAEGTIVFLPEYRNPDALRGLEEFSHVWLLFDFSSAHRAGWSATVRPPRLGGNERVGVFASRSPFRPNSIGLSVVRLLEIRQTEREGCVLVVSGADLLNGTPIYDIKPYLPYADCVPEAKGGYTERIPRICLQVRDDTRLLDALPPQAAQALVESLQQDPRPAFREEDDRVYGMKYDGFDVGFRVRNGILTIERLQKTEKRSGE